MLRLHCTPAFSKSFEIPITPQPSTSEVKKSENVFAGRANLFGKAVADNLLPCDLKDWTLIKKKMFDICFDYEQRNLNSRSTPTVPFNNFRIFTFPNVTGKKNY